ncbi:ABC transporter substrate-binding protein [Sutcliffiella deserti]|uniref:ABC transporter substrate-binding protein n=1 Tax=Sutcliffiella deserti TaxID=2875501 RepID=UPI001CC01982|nr:sugar ABC transporter substrate-binding protein [Sutcliffiella deserti]
MKRVAIIIIPLTIILAVCYMMFFTDILSSNEKNKGEEVEETEQIELTFWRNLGNDQFNKAYDQLVADFEAANPNIKINMQALYWGQEYELRLRTELAAGNHPDIMTIDSPNLGLYAKAGTLLSISRYMKEEGNLADILKPTITGLTYDGEIYLAPIVESSIALYYNKHLFREADIPFPSEDPDNPLTWEEVLEIALKIHNPKEGVYGIDPAQGFGDGEGPAYFKMPILWQFGGSVLSPDGTTADGYLNSEDSLKALQFYQDLYLKHNVATMELPPAALETNKLAMTVLGSWDLLDLNNVPDFTLEEDFGVAPLPKGKYQVAPSGGWAVGISSQTEYPDEAWEFVKYVTSYEGSKKFVEITGEIPARYSVANSLPELNEYPKNIFIQQGQKYSRNRPVTSSYSVISDAIKVLFEEVGIKGRDVKQAADDAVAKIDAALQATEVD